MSTIPSGFFARGVVFVLTRPLHLFMGTEARGALLLLVATVAALVWVNSPWAASYETLWSTRLSVQVGEAELAKDLRHWVNDGLMVLFFLVVGVELSRQLKLGELRDWRAMTMPAVAAAGGVVVPALLYLAFNPSGPAARGWPIALAGDLALVLGVLALVGPRCPPQLRVLLLTLVLVGDIAAIAVIALLNAEVVNLLAVAVALELFAVVTVLRLLRVLRTFAYLVVGVALWVATSTSGIHPAIAGLLLGVVLTAYPPVPAEVLRGVRFGRWFEPDPTPAMLWETPLGVGEAVHPIQRLQDLLHPWSSYLVVPVFALANAGVALDRDMLARAVGSPITLGVLAGLVVGKLVGIVGASLLVVRVGLGTLPRLVTRQQLAAAAALAGIGFTVALFVTDLAFTDRVAEEEAKVGILVASAAATTIGWLLFRMPVRPSGRRPHVGGAPPAGGAGGAGR
ncbi:MAG TPA: Na+/H+ antiporter NhaA [Actinomycetes bacterium]|nr:Na+/H+ antiporter NhaA [Actinomycetes bacterium]